MERYGKKTFRYGALWEISLPLWKVYEDIDADCFY